VVQMSPHSPSRSTQSSPPPKEEAFSFSSTMHASQIPDPTSPTPKHCGRAAEKTHDTRRSPQYVEQDRCHSDTPRKWEKDRDRDIERDERDVTNIVVIGFAVRQSGAYWRCVASRWCSLPTKRHCCGRRCAPTHRDQTSFMPLSRSSVRRRVMRRCSTEACRSRTGRARR
jgi:hypothetical protein